MKVVFSLEGLLAARNSPPFLSLQISPASRGSSGWLTFTGSFSALQLKCLLLSPMLWRGLEKLSLGLLSWTLLSTEPSYSSQLFQNWFTLNPTQQFLCLWMLQILTLELFFNSNYATNPGLRWLSSLRNFLMLRRNTPPLTESSWQPFHLFVTSDSC